MDAVSPASTVRTLDEDDFSPTSTVRSLDHEAATDDDTPTSPPLGYDEGD